MVFHSSPLNTLAKIGPDCNDHQRHLAPREDMPMPVYKIRFLIETPLRADEDINFRCRDHALTLLMRTGNHTPESVELEVTCEGDTYMQAVAFASNDLIPPVLDALSFHRKTTLLLGDFTQALKAEPGLTRRKVILKDPRTNRVTIHFDRTWTRQVQQIIDADPALRALSLRWLRNACRPQSIPDRFLAPQAAGSYETFGTTTGCFGTRLTGQR